MSALPLRLVYVVDSLRPGGAEQLILTTVRHLDRSRFDPVVIALSPPGDLRQDLERAGAPVHVLRVSLPVDFGGLLRLARLLRRYRPDLVHTHLRAANLYGRAAAILAGRPIVVTSFHHLDYSYWPPRSWRERVWKQLDKWSARLVNRGFIAVSKAVRADYRQHFGLPDIRLVYNYLDLEQFRPPLMAERQAIRASLDLAEGDFVILNVARLSREKGQRVLLEALALLLKRAPETRLLVLGDGPDRDELEALAHRLKVTERVCFLGVSHNVSRVLGAADVFAFPSLGEGLGIALMEAMAVGLPVVAAASDGIRELVIDGVDGSLVPANDPVALADAILRIRTDPEVRRSLGEEARRSAARRFDAGIGVRKLEATYMDFLSRSAPAGAQGSAA